MAAPSASSAKRMVTLWITALILGIAIGRSGAQPNTSDSTAQPKLILFLHSYGQNFQPWATWSTETRRALNRQSPWPLGFQEHSLVTALGGDATADAAFVDYLTSIISLRFTRNGRLT
jgi:hypothetical protein